MTVIDIPTQVQTLAAEVAYMRDQPVSRGWNALWERMEQLDRLAAPGLAIGRFLLLPSGDGREPYLVDQIEEQRVHVIYLGIDNGPSAPMVDNDGWCLRSVAEREVARRDGGSSS